MSARYKQVQTLLSGLNYKERSAVEIQIIELWDHGRQVSSLLPQVDNYSFNDGTQQQLFKLKGTIKIQFRSKKYNIPVEFWLPLNFPADCPICYVKPTPGMAINEKHMYVDSEGCIYHPYLTNWKSKSNGNLAELIVVLCAEFGKHPPLYVIGKQRKNKRDRRRRILDDEEHQLKTEEDRDLDRFRAEIKEQNRHVINELKQQIKENKDLQAQNNRLLDEQKEYQTTIHDLRLEISKLKQKSMDTVNYMNWKYEDIVMWIMSLSNNRFNKYHDQLLQSLKEEGIQGVHLDEVNEVDIKGWGVKNFEDKKFLMTKIKELRHQNNKQNNDANHNYNNEGALTAYIG
eukprot:107907_1